jgi:hypothetical protein
MGVILISPAMDGYGCMSQEERFEMGEEEYAERLQAYRAFRGQFD